MGEEAAWDPSCLVKPSRHPSGEDSPPPLSHLHRETTVGEKPSLNREIANNSTKTDEQACPPVILSTEGQWNKVAIRVLSVVPPEVER